MTELQPYDRDRPCPKCGETGMETDYTPHKGFPFYRDQGWQ